MTAIGYIGSYNLMLSGTYSLSTMFLQEILIEVIHMVYQGKVTKNVYQTMSRIMNTHIHIIQARPLRLTQFVTIINVDLSVT